VRAGDQPQPHVCGGGGIARLGSRVQRQGTLALDDPAQGQAIAGQGVHAGGQASPRLALTAFATRSHATCWRPAPGWQVATTLRHVSAQFEDDRETDSLAPATTIDAFIAAPLVGKLAFVLRAENLTDAAIITRNQGGSIDFGIPRTVWLGLRYGF